jgi:hypothetical protein
MALGTGLSGTGGTMDKYVPEIWSKRIQAAFERNTIAKDNGLDLSDLVTALGGDLIHVPKIANRTATTRSLTSFAEISPAAPTEGEFTMNVQTWATDDEFISDALPAQTKIWRMEQLDGKMQQSIAEKFDTDLFANYTTLTVTKGTDDGSTPLGPDDIFSALEALDSAYVPKMDRVIVLSPKTFWGFVKNNVITSADFTSEKSKESGRLPQLGGVPVLMSQNLPTTANGSKVSLVLHKEALAFAIAKSPSVLHEHYAARRGTIVGADMIYGTGCYRAEAGVTLYGL